MTTAIHRNVTPDLEQLLDLGHVLLVGEKENHVVVVLDDRVVVGDDDVVAPHHGIDGRSRPAAGCLRPPGPRPSRCAGLRARWPRSLPPRRAAASAPPRRRRGARERGVRSPSSAAERIAMSIAPPWTRSTICALRLISAITLRAPRRLASIPERMLT